MAKRKRAATLPRPRNGAASLPREYPRPIATAPAPRAAPVPAPAGPPPALRWDRVDLWIMAGLVVIGLLLYSYRLTKPMLFVFDEVYHAFTARELAQGNSDAYLWDKTPPPNVAYEWTHPALSKLIFQIGIRAFDGGPLGWVASRVCDGNPAQTTVQPPNPTCAQVLGWRSVSALFGALGVGLIFAMGRAMFGRVAGLLAGSLLLMEGLWFVEARIGMNDVFLTSFIMAAYFAFFMYLRGPAVSTRRYLWLCGLALGLAVATKWSAAYSLGVIGVLVVAREAWDYYRARQDELTFRLVLLGGGAVVGGLLALMSGRSLVIGVGVGAVLTAAAIVLVETLRQHNGPHRLVLLKQAAVIVGAFAVLPGVIYLAAYSQFFAMGHSWDQFVELQKQMYWYHSRLKATHTYASRWWEWPLMLQPVWYWVDYNVAPNKIANIFGMGNPLIFWSFLPAAAFALWDWSESRFRTMALAVILLGFFGQWLPWMLSPRVSFLYHMLPSVPFGILAIAFGLSRLRATRMVVAAYMLPVLVAFIYFYPLYSGYPVSKDYTEQHYWLEKWKPR